MRLQKNKLLLFNIITLLFCFNILLPNIALAQDSLVINEKCICTGTGKATEGECLKYCTGDYKLNDILGLAKKWITIVISVIGSIVLLFFIYGGVLFVISAGNQETVTKAKRVITGSIIGLLIVFLSYTIIYFTAKTLGVNVPNNIFKSDWFKD